MKVAEEIKKIREMKDKDLQTELAKVKKELTLLSLKVKAGKAQNIAEINKSRKNLARILTIMSERTRES